MTRKEWRTLASFGALALALGIYDPKLALKVVGVASLVVAVRHSDQISKYVKG